MAITQFEQTTIDRAATRHNELSEQLRSQLLQLENEVETTLRASTSGATRALASTYDQWFRDVERMIIQRTGSLTDAMRTTAASQQDTDEQGAAGISAVASFIAG